jgi:hypothetical protein
MWRLLAVAILTLSIAGCATAPPSPLGADQIKSLRLTEISVVTAPDAKIIWGNAEQEFVTQHRTVKPSAATRTVAETGSLPDAAVADTAEYNEIVKSPEAQAYVRHRAEARVRESLEVSLKPALQTGARPVRLEVSISEMFVPSAALRVVVGGVPTIMATAVLKDAATGETLATNTNQLAAATAGNGVIGVLVDQGFSDLDARVANSYAEAYRRWLLHDA